MHLLILLFFCNLSYVFPVICVTLYTRPFPKLFSKVDNIWFITFFRILREFLLHGCVYVIQLSSTDYFLVHVYIGLESIHCNSSYLWVNITLVNTFSKYRYSKTPSLFGCRFVYLWVCGCVSHLTWAVSMRTHPNTLPLQSTVWSVCVNKKYVKSVRSEVNWKSVIDLELVREALLILFFSFFSLFLHDKGD